MASTIISCFPVKVADHHSGIAGAMFSSDCFQPLTLKLTAVLS